MNIIDIEFKNDFKSFIDFFAQIRIINSFYMVRINKIDNGFLLRFVSDFAPRNTLKSGDEFELFRGGNVVAVGRVK